MQRLEGRKEQANCSFNGRHDSEGAKRREQRAKAIGKTCVKR